MKKANKRILILLLCFALLATMFTGCSTKSGTSSKADLAEGLEEYGVGYFIKPLDYQAAVVDEIRTWCSKNLDKDSEGL